MARSLKVSLADIQNTIDQSDPSQHDNMHVFCMYISQKLDGNVSHTTIKNYIKQHKIRLNHEFAPGIRGRRTGSNVERKPIKEEVKIPGWVRQLEVIFADFDIKITKVSDLTTSNDKTLEENQRIIQAWTKVRRLHKIYADKVTV